MTGRSASRDRVWLRLGPQLLFVTLVVAVYAVPLFARRNFSGRDLLAYNLPMEKSVHDAYARGRLPVWTPEVSGGRPLLPNPNVGALYPVRAILATLPFPLSSRIFPVFHWIMSGLGVFALVRTIGRTRSAAWVGAVTYAFSGVAVSEVFFPHIHPGMTLLPWLLWAAARPATTPWRRILPLSCLFTLAFLAADVFTCSLAIASVALWISLESPASGRARELGAFAAAVALGALAAAPQIVATALWIPQTNRAVLGMTLGDSVYFSIHPWRLLELIVPFPFGDVREMSNSALWGGPLFRGRPMGIFATLYCGAFAVIAVCATWKLQQKGAHFGRWLFLAVLAIAVPPSLLSARWTAGIPSPLPLRNPEKLAVALALALAVLAALAVDVIRQSRRRHRWPLVVGALLAGLALATAMNPPAAARVAVGVIGAPPLLGLPRAEGSLPLAITEAGLLWMAAVVAIDGLGRGTTRSLLVALFLLTAAPIVANRPIAKSFREEDVFGRTAFARFLQKHDPEGSYRTLGESYFLGASPLAEETNDATLAYSDFSRRTWTHDTPIFWGRGMVINEDFDTGDLSRVESLRRVAGIATGYLDSSALFGSLALRWGIRFADQRPISGYRPIRADAFQVWDEHASAFPDIRLLERWRETEGAIPALVVLPGLAAGEAVVESGSRKSGSSRPGTVRVVERSAERLVLDLDATDPTWLFVLRAYWPYRSIELDGLAVEAVPAQLAFSAVPVPAGKHRLVWVERVPGLAASAWGPIAFGVAALGLVVAGSRRRTS